MGEERNINTKSMPKTKKLQKSISEYISKIKKQTPHLQFSNSSLSHTTSKIFSGCKHPKSLSFDHNDHGHHDQNEDVAATLEDIDKFLVENFKSLYAKDDDQEEQDHEHKAKHEKETINSKGIYHDHDAHDNTPTLGRGELFDSPKFFSPRFLPPPSDQSDSHRFFVSPASSGSLLDEARTSGTRTIASEDIASSSTSTTHSGVQENHDTHSAVPKAMQDCIAILTVSPSPYEDFKKSMQEVIEARVRNSQKVDWDFMEELLFCYIRLNERKQHRYILSAFVDSVVVLRQNSNNRGPEASRNLGSQNRSDSKGKELRNW